MCHENTQHALDDALGRLRDVRAIELRRRSTEWSLVSAHEQQVNVCVCVCVCVYVCVCAWK